MSFFKAFLCTLLAALQPQSRILTVACVDDSLTCGLDGGGRLTESRPAVPAQTEGPPDLKTLDFSVCSQTVTSKHFNG